jgi:hypothetical protein
MKTILFTLVGVLFSNVSMAADSIACARAGETSAVILLYKSQSKENTYLATMMEGLVPNYIDHQEASVSKEDSSDVITLKDEDNNQITIKLDKSLLSKEVEEEGTGSLTIEMRSNSKVKHTEDLDCVIYE